MKFRYKNLGDGILRPIILVDFWVNNEKQQTHVLVDSGADRSLLPAELGEVLGLDIASGQVGKFMGVTGVEKDYFLHEIDISVGGHRFSTEVAFTYALPSGSIGVVGQYGFFDLFVVKFDLLKEEIELKPRK